MLESLTVTSYEEVFFELGDERFKTRASLVHFLFENNLNCDKEYAAHPKRSVGTDYLV